MAYQYRYLNFVSTFLAELKVYSLFSKNLRSKHVQITRAIQTTLSWGAIVSTPLENYCLMQMLRSCVPVMAVVWC